MPVTGPITVTGASDDTIEIAFGSHVLEELYAYDPHGVRLTFSDGNRLWVRYPTHKWDITCETIGAAVVQVEVAPVGDLDRDHTDRATLYGPVEWVDVEYVDPLNTRRVQLDYPTQSEPGS